MKLLPNENLSRRAVAFLLDAFPETTQIALLGLEHANDQTIWEYAKPVRRNASAVPPKAKLNDELTSLEQNHGTPIKTAY